MMELGAYDFSEKYGWLEDQFGVSWQLLITDQPFDDRIRPSFMFINDNVGRAEEAINYYTSVFKTVVILVNFITQKAWSQTSQIHSLMQNLN